MNILGHLALAGGDEDIRTGQFLGDFCRGPVHGLPYRPTIQRGIKAHRRVDARGDVHPFIRQAKGYLPPESRRYGGIVMDMLCDWLLHENWDKVVGEDKQRHLAMLRDHLARPEPDWPHPAKQFAGFLVDHDVLHAYAHLSEIRYALGRLGHRLRRPANLVPLIDPLIREERWLHREFITYFQDMQRAAAGEPGRNMGSKKSHA